VRRSEKKKPLTKEKGRIEVILPPLRLFLRGCSIGADSHILLSDKYFYSNPASGGTGRIPLRVTKLLFFVKNEGLRRGNSLENGGRETAAAVNQYRTVGRIPLCEKKIQDKNCSGYFHVKHYDDAISGSGIFWHSSCLFLNLFTYNKTVDDRKPTERPGGAFV
jgi:hypothetical protein